jgi:hypothetical protein
MDFALLIWVRANILIKAFYELDAGNEIKVSIDNDEARITFTIGKKDSVPLEKVHSTHLRKNFRSIMIIYTIQLHRVKHIWVN